MHYVQVMWTMRSKVKKVTPVLLVRNASLYNTSTPDTTIALKRSDTDSWLISR